MPLAENSELRATPGFVRSGKVRDLFDLGDRLLLVASDRLSAFDVVLPTPIPDKGRVLTGLSRFWFDLTNDIIANHLLSTDPETLPGEWTADARAELRGRMMVCRKARVLPVEVIVRGYVSGSGWKDYQRTGAICGIPLQPGLRESDRLPEPIFTPSTKAEVGHDENISFDRMVEIVGPELSEQVRDVALRLYRRGAERAEEAGIILADTKFEFGMVTQDGATRAFAEGEPRKQQPAEGRLLLIDEVMTPDSSRFWPKDDYEPGRAQRSFDKQPVRDWLETQPWNKTYPGPELPPEIVADTRRRYVTAFERITGASFERYLKEDVIAP